MIHFQQKSTVVCRAFRIRGREVLDPVEIGERAAFDKTNRGMTSNQLFD
jgi:hypothetical protein